MISSHYFSSRSHTLQAVRWRRPLFPMQKGVAFLGLILFASHRSTSHEMMRLPYSKTAAPCPLIDDLGVGCIV